MPVDLTLREAERGVDVLCLLGQEDTAAIADEHFGGTMLVNRGVQHHQIGGEVLLAGHSTSENGTAEVLDDRDAVDLPAIEPMVEIADVDRPVLVSTLRPKRHDPGLM